MRRIQVLGLVVVSAVAGCTTRTVQPSGGAASAVAPALVAERFLNAANASDLNTMGLLFGTRSGPVIERDPRGEVEQRMFALASVLRHQDYRLEGERVVPGRTGEAVQLVIRLRFPDRQVSVPFTMVQSRRHGWLVEQIEIEAITGRR